RRPANTLVRPTDESMAKPQGTDSNVEPPTDASDLGLFVNAGRDRNVLQADAEGLEECDVVCRLPAGSAQSDNAAQFHDIDPLQCMLIERGCEVAGFQAALFLAIDHNDVGPFHRLDVDFRFGEKIRPRDIEVLTGR